MKAMGVDMTVSFRQDRRVINLIERYRKNRKYFSGKKVLLASIIFGIVLLTGILTCTRLIYASSGAKEMESGNKTGYKSVMIYFGDTLETVAEKYGMEEYASPDAYMEEVCRINHLQTYTALVPGNYIIIPCYCTADVSIDVSVDENASGNADANVNVDVSVNDNVNENGQ